MRLLNSTSLELREFFEQEIPPYAIISHRWTKEETTYEDFLHAQVNSLVQQWTHYGWIKISKACEIARAQSIEWIWIDTICIDKRSSAELSEAINSMFRWYKKSEECWVFLPDVHDLTPSTDTKLFGDVQKANLWQMVQDPSLLQSVPVTEFVSSEWFTRAWTLQELLAPPQVFFFNTKFKCIGFRESIKSLITEASNIPEKYISLPTASIFEACVAERMKWASQRKATREEDLAYSLLGIFDVNMPLLYGEGRKAFRRLQTEIIRVSTDESIFAWKCGSNDNLKGLLAPETINFSNSLYTQSFFARQHYEVTNKGIRLTLSVVQHNLLELLRQNFAATILVPLNCGLSRPESRGGPTQHIVCLRVLVNEDPQWANSMEPVSKHLTYLLGSRLELVLVDIPKGHRLQIPGLLYECLHPGDGSGRLAQDLIAGFEIEGETQVDIPVYFWTG